MKPKLFSCVLLCLLFFNLSAAPPLPLEGNAKQSNATIRIERLSDGTSLITIDGETEYGFKFAIPENWYPVAVPASDEEIDRFLAVIAENNIPLPQEWAADVLTKKDEAFDLLVFDVNPNHEQYVYTSALFLGKMEIPASTPDWVLIAFLKGAEQAGEMASVNFQEIDGQLVGIFEVTASLGEDKSVFGKVFFFIRGGELIAFAGATDYDGWIPDIDNTMEAILASFDFDLQN